MGIGLMLSHALNSARLRGVVRAGLGVGLGGDDGLRAACQRSSASCWCAWGATLVVSLSGQCCAGWCRRLSRGCRIWTVGTQIVCPKVIRI
jgi:hypothetical protein